MTQTKVAAPFVQNNLTFRNTIINGDMRIAQRQTSSTGLTSSTTAPGVDRFNLIISGLGTWTVQQSTDVPAGEGFSNSLKFDNTTADASPASGDFAMCQYKYEGQHLQGFNKGTASAKKFAVSFYVKSSKTGTHIVSLSDQDNSRQVSQAYTVDSADTWERKKMIFPADTTGTFDNDNAFSLQIFWWLGAGSDRTSGTLNTSWGSITNANRAVGQVNLADNTSNNWYITGVQIEVGDQCSEFEHLPRDVQLQRCMRYFQKTGGNAGDQVIVPTNYCVVATTAVLYVGFSTYVPMRGTITLSATDCEALYGAAATQTMGAFSVFDNVVGSTGEFHGCSAQGSASAGTPFTAGNTAGIRTATDVDHFVSMDAEL